MVVAELEHGLLLVQVTRDDGLQYSGVLAADECTLLDIAPLPTPPLLSAVVETPVRPAAPDPPVSAADGVTAHVKRSYVKSGIYSKKNRTAAQPAAIH